MSNFEIGVLTIVGVVLLIQSGMHVAIVLMLLSFLAVWAMRSFVVAGKLLAFAAAEKIAFYEFGVIPLFVLMGLLVAASDIGRDTFAVANRVLGRLRGGLAVSTVGANAVFAAVTGTSIASASVFTKIAVPEMVRYRYTTRFAVGVVAGSSVLGMLIPPSLLLIIYGIITETSIGSLFIAGIIPGIVLAAAFAVAIYFLSWRFPGFTGAGAQRRPIPDAVQESALAAAGKVVPILLLMVLILGGIYGGFFTPTEAGGVGALGALVLGLLRRRLTLRKLWDVAIETGYVTASISFLLIAAQLYASMLAMSGIPGQIAGAVSEAELGFATIMVGYLAIVLLLGTFLDSVSIMVIVLPFVLPMIDVFDANLVWFGIVTVIAAEIGLLTPPLGLSCFVIYANLDDGKTTINDIFAGAFPFMLTMVVVLALVVSVPWLSLVLV